MKKFLSLILVITFGLFVNAQVVMTETDPAGAASTVNTNADTSYHTVSLAGQTFNYQLLQFVLAGTKTSGTVAGTAVLLDSVDNSRWFALTDSAGVATQNLTDGDTNFKWEVLGTRWRYYRIRVITTGTQVSAYDCRLLGRKVAN